MLAAISTAVIRPQQRKRSNQVNTPALTGLYIVGKRTEELINMYNQMWIQAGVEILILGLMYD